jgi:1-phosphofructokinase
VLRSAGALSVLASLGPDGAVLVDRDGVVFGAGAVDEPRSSVGAGDCLLAGYLAARSSGATGRQALATALAWAAAAVELPGSAVPGPAAIARRRAHVEVADEVDRQRVLTRSG